MDKETEIIKTTPLPQKYNLNLTLLIIGGIVLVLLIILLFQNIEMKRELSILKSPPASQIILLPTPFPLMELSETTENWKTYTNDQYKFTFKYSELLQLTTGNTSRNIVTVAIPETNQIGIMGCAKFQFSVGIVDDNEWNELQKTKEFRNPQSINIDNVMSLKSVWDYPMEGSICNSSLVIIPPHSNYNNRYSLAVTKVQSQYQEIFDQILNTFKFVDN
ncbi:MAG: hypothetical protein AAB874_03455, partial [Patescibacteria group bacterium]